MAEVKWKQAQIIEAEDVIGVRVSESNGMNEANLFSDQLRSQIGCGVDQQVSFRQSCDHRTSQPFVSRIVALAYLAPAADGRDTD